MITDDNLDDKIEEFTGWSFREFTPGQRVQVKQVLTAPNDKFVQRHGLLWLNGHMMHVCAFEVRQVQVDNEEYQGDDLQPVNPLFIDDLNAICQLIGDVPAPVTLPGLTGLWVLYCMPKGAR